jgi:ankyrin repeat protein
LELELGAHNAAATPQWTQLRKHLESCKQLKELLETSAWSQLLEADVTRLINKSRRDISDGVTPLHVAGIVYFHATTRNKIAGSTTEDERVALSNVQCLLDRGAKATLTDNKGENALHDAVKNDCPELAGVLLSCGADVNSQTEDEEGKQPLTLAASACSLPMVTLLIEHGANAAARDSCGYTALHWLCDQRKEFLWDQEDVSAMVSIANLLIENDCPVDTKDDQSNTTALAWLITKHKVAEETQLCRVAEVLMGKGADQHAEFVDHADDSKLTVLSYAQKHNLHGFTELFFRFPSVEQGPGGGVAPRGGEDALEADLIAACINDPGRRDQLLQVLLKQGGRDSEGSGAGLRDDGRYLHVSDQQVELLLQICASEDRHNACQVP